LNILYYYTPNLLLDLLISSSIAPKSHVSCELE